jgi:hypothetical protein
VPAIQKWHGSLSRHLSFFIRFFLLVCFKMMRLFKPIAYPSRISPTRILVAHYSKQSKAFVTTPIYYVNAGKKKKKVSMSIKAKKSPLTT